MSRASRLQVLNDCVRQLADVNSLIENMQDMALPDETQAYRDRYVANLTKRRAELEVVIRTYRRQVQR